MYINIIKIEEDLFVCCHYKYVSYTCQLRLFFVIFEISEIKGNRQIFFGLSRILILKCDFFETRLASFKRGFSVFQLSFYFVSLGNLFNYLL